MFKRMTPSCFGKFLLIFIFSVTNYSQTEIVDSQTTQNCENVAAIIGYIVQEVSVDKNIIIVAHKGKNETVKNIAERRLHNAKAYLTKYFQDTKYSRSPEKVITGVGTELTEEGKVDFYIDGNLTFTFLFRKDKDFIFYCQYERDISCKDKYVKLFYPCFEKPKNLKK